VDPRADLDVVDLRKSRHSAGEETNPTCPVRSSSPHSLSYTGLSFILYMVRILVMLFVRDEFIFVRLFIDISLYSCTHM
jgi:hypothetical protein